MSLNPSNRAPPNTNSHPLHPATVHFPISFISLACALDVLFGAATNAATSKLVTSVYDVTPYIGDISRASHFLNLLGLITAIPAILTGSQQLIGMIKVLGLQHEVKDANGKVLFSGVNPKVKAGIAHAAVNDLVVLLTAYKWWSRKDNPAYVPDGTNILLSTLALPGVLFGAYLGGQLVYKYSVGVTKLAKEVSKKGQ